MNLLHIMNLYIYSIYFNIFADLLKALNWLTAWSLDTAVKRFEQLQSDGKDAFETRNNIQVFAAQKLSIIYAEVGFSFQITLRLIFLTHLSFLYSAPLTMSSTSL